MSPRLLFVLTSADKNLKGAPTGWFLPEAAHPYWHLLPHAEIDFASPKGPNPPLDEGASNMFKDEGSNKFREDETVKAKLASAKKLSEVNVSDYDGVFYIGGHGPVLDLASDPVNATLASEFFRAGKITAAICHGTAALVGATDANGKSILEGREVTGFTDAEEEAAKMGDTIPFLVETRVRELGGKFVSNGELWGPKVAVAGNLITGQNPASAQGTAEAMLAALQRKA